MADKRQIYKTAVWIKEISLCQFVKLFGILINLNLPLDFN